MVARLRTCADAAWRHADASAAAPLFTAGCDSTSLSVANAPMNSSSPCSVMPRSSLTSPMSMTLSSSEMPSRNQFSSSVPPAITVAYRGSTRPPSTRRR